MLNKCGVFTFLCCATMAFGLTAELFYSTSTCTLSNLPMCTCACCNTNGCTVLTWAGLTQVASASCTQSYCQTTYSTQCSAAGTTLAESAVPSSTGAIAVTNGVCTSSGGNSYQVTCAAGNAWTASYNTGASCDGGFSAAGTGTACVMVPGSSGSLIVTCGAGHTALFSQWTHAVLGLGVFMAISKYAL